ncbi:MAG: DUF262 domain-containing protein, partial [Firmicutes bacterium]|nr:DUF262 domain-containing protein [Bacillota bacterium]
FDSLSRSIASNYRTIRIDTSKTDVAILDGQQRLTSLFLTFYGMFYKKSKYEKRNTSSGLVLNLYIELDENKVEVDEQEYNNKKFDIRFMSSQPSPTQFNINKIISDKFIDKNTRQEAIENEITKVPSTSKDYARNILSKLCSKVFDENLIRYTQLIDMSTDDALEMFVRFNSGGTSLKKSEVTMSIIEVYWSNARKEFGEILVGSYTKFDTDFIIRTALMLYGDVLKSNINKKIVDTLKNNLEEFKLSLNKLEELLNGFNIDIKKFESSWNVLIPIIYYIYINSNYIQNKSSILAYLTRAVFFGFFQNGTTSKLHKIKSYINQNNYEINIDMLDSIKELQVTKLKIEDVLNLDYNSRLTKEVLYYINLEHLNEGLTYQVDHLHPINDFNNKPSNIDADTFLEYRKNRDKLPNLNLYEGNLIKSGKSLIDWYSNFNDTDKQKYIQYAALPDCNYEFQYFGEFYEKRKKILEQKIMALVLPN